MVQKQEMLIEGTIYMFRSTLYFVIESYNQSKKPFIKKSQHLNMMYEFRSILNLFIEFAEKEFSKVFTLKNE